MFFHSAPALLLSNSSAQAAPASALLPRCLQSWVKLSGCKDNSDSNCFCKDPNFTNNVQQCISAWSGHQAEEVNALSYLAGICAPHIPQNPGIITNVPTTITLQPTPLASGVKSPASPSNGVPAAISASNESAPQAAASPVPQTTVSISTTITISCPASYATIRGSSAVGAAPMASGCTTTSLLNTQVIVPQVAFSTMHPGQVGLVAGTPAPAPAAPTAGPGVKAPIQPVSSMPAAPASDIANSPPAPAAAAPAAASPTGSVVASPALSQPSSSVQAFTGVASASGSNSIFMCVFLSIAGFLVFV